MFLCLLVMSITHAPCFFLRELITCFTSKTQLQCGSSQESGVSTDLQMVSVCSSFPVEDNLTGDPGTGTNLHSVPSIQRCLKAAMGETGDLT